MSSTDNRTVPVVLTDEQQAYIRGLHDLAEFLTEHPEFTPDHGVNAPRYCLTREAIVRKAQEIGGEWEQRMDGPWVKLERHFGPHLVYLYVDADKVGEKATVTERVTKWRVPDLLAPPRLSDGLVESALDLAGRDTEAGKS